MNVVRAGGWPDNETPTPAQGLTVTAYRRGLDHPRWCYVLPNGDVLVAETNAPPRPQDNKGLKGWFFKRYQKRAGAAVPSANRITLRACTICRVTDFASSATALWSVDLRA